MRNSGSLRYFGNYELEQLIGEYDQVTRQIKTVNAIDQTTYIETRKARARIFDFRYNNMANELVQSSVYTRYNQASIDSFIKRNPPLLTQDKQLFNEYAELCRSRNLKIQLSNYNRALMMATAIIKALEHDFHL
jgi:arginyl-tRNA synthetase